MNVNWLSGCYKTRVYSRKNKNDVNTNLTNYSIMDGMALYSPKGSRSSKVLSF